MNPRAYSRASRKIKERYRAVETRDIVAWLFGLKHRVNFRTRLDFIVGNGVGVTDWLVEVDLVRCDLVR